MASTSDLIEFLLNTGYGDIPSEAIQKTKLQILDCLDVTLAASKLPITEIIVSRLEESGGKAEASVLGHDCRVPCSDAACRKGGRRF